MPPLYPLERLIPKADDLLSMKREVLAPVLLKLALEQSQQVGFIPESVSTVGFGDGYPGYKKAQVDTHLTKTWNWIERNGWIEPSGGKNGQNGWRMLTDEGMRIAQGAAIEAVVTAHSVPSGLVHPAIWARCETLFSTGSYPEAVEMAFRVVRDRLRALTGFERGFEAFGKVGKLHVRGAVTLQADKDFNEGVKYLTMAIDMFRNEKAHTSEIGITDPIKALQYLVLSSLAMRLLDNAEVQP